MPPLPDGFTASQVHPHIYMMQSFLHSFSMHMPNGKPESIVTPGPDRVHKEAKRGSHKTLHVVILFVLDHKTGTRGLWQCSTRQPTVYSYTASHRSPLLRVDSPTRFTFINTTVFIPSRLTIKTSSLYH